MRRALAETGSPLDTSLKDRLEAASGADLSEVRVHSGPAAAAAAHGIGARAFALGSEIIMGASAKLLGASDREHLLAHEVAHVVQQGGGPPVVQPKLEVANSNSAAEREADAFADSFTHGATMAITQTAPRDRIHRVVETRDEDAERIPADRIKAAEDLTELIALCEDWAFGQSNYASNVRNGAELATTDEARAASETLADSIDQILSELDDSVQTLRDLHADILEGHVSVADAEPIIAERVHEVGERFADARAQIAAGQKLADAAWAAAPSIETHAKQQAATQSAVLDKPAGHSLPELGAARARQVFWTQREQWAATGSGSYTGSSSEAGKEYTDCITYAIDALSTAFDKHGKRGVWNRVRSVAYERTDKRYHKTPKPTRPKISGIDLQTALIDVAGWKAALYIADTDPTTSENTSVERHMYNLGRTRRGIARTGRGYSLYSGAKNVPGVRPVGVLDDYNPAYDSNRRKNLLSLRRLRMIELGFVTMDGGNHTCLIIDGEMYEAHLGETSDSPWVFEETPIEEFDWQSGIIVAPAATIEAIFAVEDDPAKKH